LPGRIKGSVRSIDASGNLMTDISEGALASAPRDESVRVVCDEHETLGIFGTPANLPEMTLAALLGTSGYLELAIIGDNAAAMLGVRVGTPVEVVW
jgi:S-adenosylmethionine hydrolase